MPPIEANRPIDYSLLKDKSIIVTGGASGLGEAITTKFASHGAYVTIADMNPKMGEALAKSLTSKGQHVSYVESNTTDWDSSVNAFKHAINFSPSKNLDVAALFAGTDGEAKGLIDIVDALGPPSLDGDGPGPRPPLKAVDVNLYGVYNSAYLALYYFRLPSPSKSPKSLIFVSSMMGYIDLPYV